MGRREQAGIAALAASLALIAVAIWSLPRPFAGGDFGAYWSAGQAIAAGHSPYQDLLRPGLSPFSPGSFRYPPPFALVGLVFSSFSPRAGFLTWSFLSIAAWAAALAWLWRRHGQTLPWYAPALATLAWIPLDALVAGNITLLLAAGVLAAYLALEERRDVLAGVLVGLMAVAKLEPALFGLYLLAAGRSRAAVAALLTMVLVCLGSLALPGERAAWSDYPAALAALMAMNPVIPYNFAPASVLVLLGAVPASAAGFIDKALLAVALVGAVVAGRRLDLERGWRLVAVLSLLGGSVLWAHYLAVLLGPALVALARTRSDRGAWDIAGPVPQARLGLREVRP